MRINRITEKLTTALQPTRLEVRDVSHTHAGHAGAGEETHFTVTVASPLFAGKTRLQQHQMMNAALADEFTDGLHALQVHVVVE
jgi:BolA protein